jgi:hypothetical protein
MFGITELSWTRSVAVSVQEGEMSREHNPNVSSILKKRDKEPLVLARLQKAFARKMIHAVQRTAVA